jgi:hypothetical protein
MFASRPDIDIIPLGIHALEPSGIFFDLGTAPCPVDHLAGSEVADADLKPVNA